LQYSRPDKQTAPRTYRDKRSFLSEAKEIWETEVQRGFLLMPVRRGWAKRKRSVPKIWNILRIRAGGLESIFGVL